MLKVASWNVNSLNVRLPHVLAWCDIARPDILALQETKLTDDRFPVEHCLKPAITVSIPVRKPITALPY